MSIYTHRAIIIIAYADKAKGNQAATTLPGATAADAASFSRDLCALGDANQAPVMTLTSTLLTEAGWAGVQQLKASGMFPGNVVEEWDIDANPNYPTELIHSHGWDWIEPVTP